MGRGRRGRGRDMWGGEGGGVGICGEGVEVLGLE